MHTFRRDQGPGYVARVDAAERAVLLDVVDEVIALVTHDDDAPDGRDNVDPLDRVLMESAPVDPPTDPALRRLLPDASVDDAEVAAEYRRLTEAELRATKRDNLRRLRAVLSEAHPDLLVLPSEGPGVAAALTDVRLVVSERLGLRTDEDAEDLYAAVASQDEPADDAEAAVRFLATVYVVLSLLQESLVELMLAELPDGASPTGPGPGPGPGRG